MKGVIAAIMLSIWILGGTKSATAEEKESTSQVKQSHFANIRYEALPADQWKMLQVGGTDEQLDLSYGKSYYAAVSLPPINGTVELRAQMPFALKEVHDALMPCVTFLDTHFKPTHSFDYRKAQLPPPLGWRFNDSSGVEMQVTKNAIDRYMIVHTDAHVAGSIVRYDLGHPTSILIPVGKYTYMAPGPSSVGLRATAKGKVRVKLFSQGKPR